VSDPLPDPAAASGKVCYAIPIEILRGMVFTLPRPAADAPDSTWQEVVQGGLDKLGTLDPHDSIEAMMAILVIAANAGALDAFRLAFEPGASAVQALRQRASAATLLRAVTGGLRQLKQQRAMPAVAARDWGGAAGDLGAAWQAAPARPAEVSAGARASGGAPATIIRWLDEVPDDELAEEVERVRREAAGEPPLPAKPGPRRIYQHKPDDYARRWKPDPRAWRHYPGWENMTLAQRRAFFGYNYDGPLAPLEVLSPAGQAAVLAEQAAEAAAEAALTAEYGF
jgi:hypothetical protein